MEHLWRHRTIKVAHVLGLLNLRVPTVKVKQLSHFRAEVECHTKSLTSFDITTDEILVTILRQKNAHGHSRQSKVIRIK